MTFLLKVVPVFGIDISEEGFEMETISIPFGNQNDSKGLIIIICC